eukprot:4534297-Pleurochrysis_carterae.AAC.2
MSTERGGMPLICTGRQLSHVAPPSALQVVCTKRPPTCRPSSKLARAYSRSTGGADAGCLGCVAAPPAGGVNVDGDLDDLTL